METKGDYNIVQSLTVGAILSAIGEDTKYIKVLEIWDSDSVHYLYERDGGERGHDYLKGYWTPPGRIVVAGRQPPWEMVYTILHELGHCIYGKSEWKADWYFEKRMDDLFSYLESSFGKRDY